MTDRATRAFALFIALAAAAGSGAAAVGASGPAAPSTGTSPVQTSAPPASPENAAALDPLRIIGLDPRSAIEALGAPREVFPLRGPDGAQDNVVFFYPDFSYLYWFGNRVWQVRYDGRFARPVLGIATGMTRAQIEAALPGKNLIALGDSLYFDVQGAGYPVRVRLVFSASILSDIYIYRSDY